MEAGNKKLKKQYMFLSKIKNRYKAIRKKRICQGDIFREISLLVDLKREQNKKQTEVKEKIITFGYAVVMSQDCDLKSDFLNRTDKKVDDQDKYLTTILICPAYQEDLFAGGGHILGLKRHPQANKEMQKIKGNDQMKRYHYLKKDSSLSIQGLVIDFKNFYTIPTEHLYKQKNKYIATINELFREELLQRFANFISRIGLPEINEHCEE